MNYAYEFLAMFLKFYWLTFNENLKALATLGTCWVTSYRQGVNENLRFSRSLEYTLESFIFFHEIFMVARSHQVLAADITMSALRLKVPILAIFF